jgi:hypothetical protein
MTVYPGSTREWAMKAREVSLRAPESGLHSGNRRRSCESADGIGGGCTHGIVFNPSTVCNDRRRGQRSPTGYLAVVEQVLGCTGRSISTSAFGIFTRSYAKNTTSI